MLPLLSPLPDRPRRKAIHLDRGREQIEVTVKEQTNQELDRLSDSQNEFTLLDLMIVLAKRKRMILRVSAAFFVVALVAVLFMSNVYTASSKVLPPQQNQSVGSSILQQLGPLSGLAQQGFNLKNTGNGELYVGILKSRTVADHLIDRFDLKKVYKQKRYVETEEQLASDSLISLGKEGFISIEVTQKDPKLAADLVNAYVDELKKLSQELAISEASQRRLFYEGQLASAKDKLSNAEVELRKTQESSGLIQLDSQAKAIIESVASIRAEIAAREVQLHALRSFATEQNSEVTRVEQELAGLRIEQEKLERRANSGNGDIQVATSRVPSAGLEYVRKFRDVKYYETMFEILAKQYETARLDEAKTSALIQTLDPASIPERKSGPHRTIMVLIITLVGGLVASAFAIALHVRDVLYGDPEQAERMILLNRLLRIRNTEA